jgi:tripartite-type tricarboxylate transporter receptor subunit TctC
MKSAVFPILIAAALAPLNAPAADSYPAKPVRMIAPFSAGGGADTVARLVAQKLSEPLGQQVIVDNRPGASNIIGTELTARSAPDGYTIMIANTVHAINAGLFKKLPYDPVGDFTAIALVATTPYMLSVHPSLPVKTVKDLVALARSRPGQINYASPGNGTAAHLAAEMLRLGTGISIVHIPYKGITQALTDTLAGRTQILISAPITALPQVKVGKLKALAVTTATRSKLLPDLPTMQEAGVRDYEFGSWYGLLAPRATPGPIVERLNESVNKVLQQNDVRARLAADAAEPAGGTSAEFAGLLKRDVKRLSDLVRKIGLHQD